MRADTTHSGCHGNIMLEEWVIETKATLNLLLFLILFPFHLLHLQPWKDGTENSSYSPNLVLASLSYTNLLSVPPLPLLLTLSLLSEVLVPGCQLLLLMLSYKTFCFFTIAQHLAKESV